MACLYDSVYNDQNQNNNWSSHYFCNRTLRLLCCTWLWVIPYSTSSAKWQQWQQVTVMPDDQPEMAVRHCCFHDRVWNNLEWKPKQLQHLFLLTAGSWVFCVLPHHWHDDVITLRCTQFKTSWQCAVVPLSGGKEVEKKQVDSCQTEFEGNSQSLYLTIVCFVDVISVFCCCEHIEHLKMLQILQQYLRN